MIDKNKAHPAVDFLLKQGLITKVEEDILRTDINKMLSLRSHALRVLGKVIGPLWLREEVCEFKAMFGSILSPSDFSLAEWLVVSTDIRTPWHDESFPSMDEKLRFNQEASEPWHWSLMFGKFNKDSAISDFFSRSDFASRTNEILRMAWEEK
jgi:hypothetical protein